LQGGPKKFARESKNLVWSPKEKFSHTTEGPNEIFPMRGEIIFAPLCICLLFVHICVVNKLFLFKASN
jgi:hypothetical protein